MLNKNNDNYLHLAHISVDCLKQTLSFINNMISHSKNKEMLEKLEIITQNINDNISKISNLYILSEEEQKTDFNYNFNLKSAIEKLIECLHSILQLLQIEGNKKVFDSLLSISFSVLNLITELNNFIVFCNYKILKLF